MKKTALSLLLVTLSSAPVFADVTVYGKANVAWQYSDKNVGGNYSELVNNASRVGLKGSELLSEDITAIYQFEYETRVDDGAGPFSQRNIFVGIQGRPGTLTMGMFDTPLKVAQEKVDLFNDMVGDLKNVLEGEVRAKNIVQYTSPKFNDIAVNVAYVNAEQDKPGAVNGYSASLAYSTKAVYVAVAADKNSKNASEQKTPLDDSNIIRVVGRFTLGDIQLGALWEDIDNGPVDEQGYLISAQWSMTEKWIAKVQHAQSDMIQPEGASTSLGLDYKLSKSTKVFAYYTTLEDKRLTKDGTGVDYAARADDKYLAAGLELNF